MALQFAWGNCCSGVSGPKTLTLAHQAGTIADAVVGVGRSRASASGSVLRAPVLCEVIQHEGMGMPGVNGKTAGQSDRRRGPQQDLPGARARGRVRRGRAQLLPAPLQRRPGGAAGQLPHGERRDRRLPGAQRRRQDHHAQDALRAAAPHRRAARRCWVHALGAPARLPARHHAGDGPAQPPVVGHPGGRLVPAQPGHLPPERRRLQAHAGRAGRAARAGADHAQAGAQPVAGRAHEVRAGGGPAAPPAGAVPGRADHRPGHHRPGAHPRVPAGVQPAHRAPPSC